MKVLIFKVNQLGDNVVFLPVVQWLEKTLPGAELAILTSPVAAPLYEHCAPRVRVLGAVTSEFNGAWKHPAALLRFRRLVRSFKPDACLVADDQGNVAHLLAWMSGAKIRVGPRESRCRTRMLLTHRTPMNLEEPVALQNWKIAAHLLDALKVDRTAMPGYPPAPDVGALCAGTVENKPFVLIHAGASRAYKRWPMTHFVDLANKLSLRVQVRFISLGGPEEAGLEVRVQREKTGSLAKLFGLMANAAFFVGNNSGPMNIAAACGVPGLIFCGPSTSNWDPMWHLDRFVLLRDPQIICQPCDHFSHPVNACQNKKNPMICMRRWTVDCVLGLVRDALVEKGVITSASRAPDSSAPADTSSSSA